MDQRKHPVPDAGRAWGLLCENELLSPFLLCWEGQEQVALDVVLPGRCLRADLGWAGGARR